MKPLRTVREYLRSRHIPVLFGLSTTQNAALFDPRDTSTIPSNARLGRSFSNSIEKATWAERLENSCFRLESFNPFVHRYIIVDTTRHFSEALFAHKGIPVRVFGRVRLFENDDYVVLQCRVWRRHAPLFQKAVADVERKILLSMKDDYLNYCRRLEASLFEHGPRLTFF